METSTPVLPVTVPVDRGYSGASAPFASYCSPYEPTLVASLLDQTAHRDNLWAVSANSKENVRETLQSRFEAERSFGAANVRIDGVERRIQEDGEKTRALMRDQENQRLRDEITALKIAAANHGS